MPLALPSLTKTWRFRVNSVINPQVNAAAAGANLLLAIKAAILGQGTWTNSVGGVAALTSAWTVQLSNGRTLGIGAAGVDNWTSSTEVGWFSSGARPWIVLQHTASGCQLLLAPALNTAVDQLTVHFSAGGLFTGGTTTVIPTATDNTVIAANTSWGANANANVTHQLHVLQSTDGDCIRIIITNASIPPMGAPGFASATWHIGRIKNPKPSITNSFMVALMAGSNGTSQPVVTTTTGFLAGSTANVWMRYASTSCRLSYTCEGTAESLGPAFCWVQSDFDGSWPAFPLGITGYTVNGRGRVGEVFDVWAPAFANYTGDAFPDSGGPGTERQFAQFGQLLYPWNGTSPVVSG